MKKEFTMRKNGFTFIELIVVMLATGILATIAIPSILNKRDRAAQAATKNNMHTLQLAAEDFATMCEGFYPLVPTTDVKTILNNLFGAGTSTNSKKIADAAPATTNTVSWSPDALLPGNRTFTNPFLVTGNCLDHIAWSANPFPPPHCAIGSYMSGSGTVYWHPCGGTSAGHHGECPDYAIYGDGKNNMLDYELRSVR
jgi:prepilin-type N-terminal cleavage/methylation domain-containing protein